MLSDPSTQANSPKNTPAILRATGLNKSFAVQGASPLGILHDITLTLQAGASYAIVGASGCGKSTLLSLLAGLDVPTSGEVYIRTHGASDRASESAETALFGLSEDQRALLRGQRMGFVFQNFQLMPNRTALQNVLLPLEILQKPAGRAAQEAAALAMLERVGLAERAHHYPRTLSGGEQQRVALARALVVAPQILFADEPTGSLDQATGDAVMALMLQLKTELGTTLVLVTHDAALAAKCEHVVKLERGQVVS